MRRRVYEIVERAEEGDKASYAYDVFIAVTAIISVIKLLVDAGEMPELVSTFVNGVDALAVTILFFDYLMRWITYDIKCEEQGWKLPDGSPMGRVAFVAYFFTPFAIIDLVSLLPSLFSMPAICKYLIILRLFKVFRMLRGLAIIGKVFIREGRTLLSILFITLLYVLCVALIMYTYEPNIFSDFIDAFYWSTTALATIGYGDISPQTQLGKVINIFSALVGIVIIALPSGIITGGYVAEVRRQHEEGLRSRRAINIKYTFDEIIEDRAAEAGEALKKKRISRYFKRNPRVVRAIVIIAAGVVVNCAMYGLITSVTFSLPLDCWGTVFAAFLLEPVAGILVGYIGNIVYSIVTGSVGNLLYMLSDIVVAIGFGSLISLKRGDGKLHLKRDVLVIFVTASVAVMVNVSISLLKGSVIDVVTSVSDGLGISMAAAFALEFVLLVAFIFANLVICYCFVLLLRPLKRYVDACEARDCQHEVELQRKYEEKMEKAKEAEAGAAREEAAHGEKAQSERGDEEAPSESDVVSDGHLDGDRPNP